MGENLNHSEKVLKDLNDLAQRLQQAQVGDDYVEKLRKLFDGRVPGQADFVCYWFEKARAQIETSKTKRAGLIATNSIRGGANRKVLEHIKDTGDIFMGWSDEPWILDGAAVRVSMVGFDNKAQNLHELNGKIVSKINSDLTSSIDVSQAKVLSENLNSSFQGIKLAGDFVIPEQVANTFLASPNPNGLSNSNVVKPYLNAKDLVQRTRGVYFVDFYPLSVEQASEFILPMAYVEEKVKPQRLENRDTGARTKWWLPVRPRPEMREEISKLSRFIGTPAVSKHRIFVWLAKDALIDGGAFAITRDDDFSFGVLHSKLHEVWALRQGTSLGVGNDPRYTPSTCFETFPFPKPSDPQKSEIEKWAKYLDDVRRGLLASDSKATLTGIYNKLVELRNNRDTSSPVYPLLIAHEKLDAAVAAAYGWAWPLTEEEILEKLLGLNLEHSG